MCKRRVTVTTLSPAYVSVCRVLCLGKERPRLKTLLSQICHLAYVLVERSDCDFPKANFIL